MKRDLRIVVPHRGLAAGKSRLAAVLDDNARQALNRRLLEQTLTTLTVWLGTARRCIVVSPCSDTRSLAQYAGAAALPDPTADLNDAVAAGAAHAAHEGAHAVLVVPGDLPFLDAAALDSLLALAGAHTTVIAPDRHGLGTNALLVGAEVRAFAFGPGSFAQHQALAAARGDSVRVCRHQALAFDLDTPEDWTAWQYATDAMDEGKHHPAAGTRAGAGT